MAITQPPDTRAKSIDESSWSHASKISRKVRELAYRTHMALTTAAQRSRQARAGSEDIETDLRDLRDQVVRLQQKIHIQRLGVLVPWVDALRRQVESRLAEPQKTEVRQ